MGKNNKIKKVAHTENKNVKEDVKKVTGGEEETEKEVGTLSDGVFEAFDELAPIDPPLEDESILPENEEGDEIDSGDYKPLDEW
ncbi:MAG: hypothetical protein C0412_18700 [Flavobacterium sp.]|nr:hypothetical protein [Flavobacterium sp.]